VMTERSTPGFWQARLAPFFEKYGLVLCLCFIAMAAARVISTYSALSLTVDEPSHFACGMEYVAHHAYTLDIQNPPLARAAIALGPYLDGLRPFDLPKMHAEGIAILAHSSNLDRTVFLMRLGNLPFFLLACLVVCVWSWHMFGKAVAVVATGLFTLLPTVLADAGLATTDTSLAATVGAAFLAAILWAERPTWVRSALLGVCLALALLAKSTALGYVPMTLGLALASYLIATKPGWRQLWSLARRRAPSAGLALVMAGLVVWAVYGFSFGVVNGLGLTLPAPDYFRGIADALAHDKQGHPAFLLGEFRTTGWWYYFPAALAVKTPIPFLMMVALGVWVCLRERTHVTYLLPLAFSFGILLPAIFGRIDIGIRHVEPMYIGLSVIAALGLIQLMQLCRAGLLCAVTAGALVVWMIVPVASHHPDYLAYFNELGGRSPEQILVDSNYDWGQDLKLLSKELHDMGVKQVSLITVDGVMNHDYLQKWYGLPTIMEINDLNPAAGLNAVSPTFANSVRFLVPSHARTVTPWYSKMPPTKRVGGLLLYYIAPSTANRNLQP
jgi:hypothetical protein